MLIRLERNKKIDLNFLFLDHELIFVNNYGEVTEEIKLCYLPFNFLKQHQMEQVNFHQHIYSSKELRMLNRENQDRPAVPSRLEVQEVIL